MHRKETRSTVKLVIRANGACVRNMQGKLHDAPLNRPTFPDARPANFGARPVSRFPMIIHLNREVASNYVGVRGLIR